MRHFDISMHTVGNLLLMGFLLLAWFLASPSIKYDTVVLPKVDFPGDASSWRIKGAHANAQIIGDRAVLRPVVAKPTSFTKLYELDRTSDAAQYLRIEGIVFGVSRDGGGVFTETGKVGKSSIFNMWFENASKERIDIHRIAILENKSAQKQYQTTVAVPEQAVALRVGLLLRQYDFEYALTSLTVSQVQHAVRYKIGLGVVCLVGLILCVLFIRSLLKRQAALVVTLVVVASVIVIGVLLPGGFLSKLVFKSLEFIPFLSGDIEKRTIVQAQEMGHFFGFLFLAPVVLQVSQSAGYRLRDVVVTMLLFTVFTEVAQRHTVQRSPSFEDLLLDIAGLIVGGLIWFFFNRVRKNELA